MAYYWSPFRKEYQPEAPQGCPFCDEPLMRQQAVKSKEGLVMENKHYWWVINWYPKFEGHTMVVPKRHILSLEEETSEEVLARHELITLATRFLPAMYEGAGVEIFLQYGKGSEGSIPHLHWHVVPAQEDDHLRGFTKLGHFHTMDEREEKVLTFPVKIKYAREELQDALSKVIDESR